MRDREPSVASDVRNFRQRTVFERVTIDHRRHGIYEGSPASSSTSSRDRAFVDRTFYLIRPNHN